MKLKPYKEMIQMANDKVKEALAPVRAAKAKAQAILEIAKLNEKIAVLENSINEMCYADEINFHNLIDKQDELALLERKKKQLTKIVDELFPD